MTEPTVSVVIVSRDRPEALARCLRGVAQQHYTNFEVVIVADRAGMAQLWAMPEAIHAKQVRYDEANIAVARNLGIIEASGEVVAFIDDDAVPEPSWLSQLSLPFLSDHVTAAGGYVLGRNGISWQWRAQSWSASSPASAARCAVSELTAAVELAGRGRPYARPTRNRIELH